ncbi:MAG: hypothetical protein KDK61_08725 [Simkania sp.]|nr:hypothetical protein [Nanoarchaeota archaeon]MCB1084381.1 hypothetical protein [Simkania sp.]
MFAKKGNISLITLMEVILGLVVALLFFSAADALGNPYQFERFTIAKDVSLLVDAIQAVPATVHYEYPETSYGTNILLEKDGRVSVIPDTKEVPDRDALIITRYSFIPSTLFKMKDTLVDGGFFLIDKRGSDIIFSNKTSTTSFDDEVNRIKKEDIVFALETSSQGTEEKKSFLERQKNDLQGKLQSASFSFSGEPNRYVGFSLGEQGVIYYADLAETKALATQLQKNLLIQGYEFLLVKGTSLFSDEKISLEIMLSPQQEEAVASQQLLLTTVVKGTIETFYEK